MNLRDKVAIVTGANQGIGKAVSERLAKQGVNIALVSNKKTELIDVSETIQTLGAEALPIEVDVRKKSEVDDMALQVTKRFGKIDFLINNAGMSYFGGVNQCTEQEWDTTMDTNVKGYFLTSKAVLPHMTKAKSGVIVNMSSIWGKRGSANMVAYSTSKFAIEGFTQSLSEEVKPQGVKVSSIILDKVDTPFRDNMTEFIDFSDEQKGKMLTSEDVADSVLWILQSSRKSLPSSVQLDAWLWS